MQVMLIQAVDEHTNILQTPTKPTLHLAHDTLIRQHSTCCRESRRIRARYGIQKMRGFLSVRSTLRPVTFLTGRKSVFSNGERHALCSSNIEMAPLCKIE